MSKLRLKRVKSKRKARREWRHCCTLFHVDFQRHTEYIWCMDATMPHFMLWTATKLKFSNGYYSVIFKVKIYDKISRHWELPREFKNAKIFPKKIWEDFFKNIWKLAIFNNWKNIFLKIDDFQIFFLKSSQFFLKYFCSFELARKFSMSIYVCWRWF